MSDMDFEAGRQQGWSERDQYTRERQYAYARSLFGWPLMGISGLITLWCLLIYGLSGTQVIEGSTLLILLTLGTTVGLLGWFHNKREREEQMHRIDDFHSRWGIVKPSSGPQSNPQKSETSDTVYSAKVTQIR